LSAASNQPTGHFTTLYFLPPAKGATTFSLTVDVVQQKFGNKIKTSFKDIALPTLPSQAATTISVFGSGN
jgi:hypothetical protein